MRRLGLLFIFLIINAVAFAQQGAISGKVTDKKTGEGVIGATVLVTGTVQAAPVDVEGKYELKLAPGTYSITMTYIGYKPLTFAGVVVTANAKTTLNGVMEENTTNLQEVTVTGQKQTGTEVAMIQDLKRSEVVVSGMSNDQIVKTLDRDAAEVVKRIPGVTIQSNNFIVIRGLAERYNTVLLNDALTPSAEVDTRSFSFDILPSSVIDRVLIFKSGAPELPGEMGGGVVKVYTKNSVLENATSLSVSGWARSNTTFKDGYQVSSRSNTDWLGFDNGARQMPSGTPEKLADATQPQFRNEWVPSRITARPDLRISLGLSRHYEIGSTYLSNVTSLSYSNTHEQTNVTRSRYQIEVDPATNQPRQQYLYNDQRAVTGTRLGIIHNWQARFNDRNRVEFRNFLNQLGTDEVTHRTGQILDQGLDRQGHALHYQSRTIYSGQLQGSHDLGPNEHTNVTWAAGYNYVYKDEPDYSRYNSQRRTPQEGEAPKPFLVIIPNGGNPYDASRFFSNLSENTYMGSGQWERRIKSRRDTTRASQYKVRAGFYAEQKKRQFENRYFSYVPGSTVYFEDENNIERINALTSLPIDRIFAPENLDPKTGFKLSEGTVPRDRYTAENTLVAGYLSAVAPLTDQLNLSGGVRLEYNRKSLVNGSATDTSYLEKRWIPMPSVNATYNFNQRSLLRLASSVTVNRPEFREVANYSYFDYSNNAIITGNRNLKTATIYNADLRYEFYPSRSELLSVGVFYKYFRDAIEQSTQSVSTEQMYLTFQNADNAYDVGVEVEARKSFLELTQSPFLQRFSVVLNASVIKSRVQLKEDANNQNFALSDRALQGQSPYVVNAGLFYQDDENHWQVSAQYNVIGQRIQFAGDRQFNYSVIEMPRHVIDLAVTKGIGQHLQLKAGIQDLLNQKVRQYYDFDRDGKISSTERGPFAEFRRGSYSTLGLTYNF
ncbi:TonB-dependent receptor [Hymenobacter aquaticus]|uniref:TonB-dependent receptor n=1 Tax=Hymenobacter aquaticus TaxID=1867101 RepID=A0A4Z0PVJ3_9BACT|nr:TonB-dependent receptor [Hymenobacter aquaticus]TGE21757.1 TonB-dependent receptor [Hymenobacter aquaticus]